MNYQPGIHYTLERDGVQVIENVLTETEIQTLRDQMWKYLHHLTLGTRNPILEK